MCREKVERKGTSLKQRNRAYIVKSNELKGGNLFMASIKIPINNLL